MEYLLVGWWLLAFAALSALAFPLCARVFERVPGHGVGFAPIVAVFTLTVVGYWTGQVRFGRHTLWLGLLALAGLSAAAGLDREALRGGRVQLAPDLDRVDPRAAAPAVVVFLAAFLLLVLVRGADPAVSAIGGEKFLDYGLLRTLLRAETLPPYDMWFAGEPVNYYYGGHLAASLLTRLTSTPPAYAYNLALAGFYATLVTAAFELARGIAAGRAVDRGDSGEGTDPSAHGIRAGLAAAFFVGLASNLVTAGRLALGLLPDGLATALAGFVAARSRVSAEELLAGTGDFYYWTASRVIPGTINEFPFFGFLNGDLHAHMMVAPFLLLGAGVAHAYWRTPATALRRRRALVFGAVPLLGGTIIVVHTWDFPTLVGVVWLALAFAPATPLTLLPRGDETVAALRERLGTGVLATELERTGGALVVAGVAGVVGFLLGAPFFFGAATGQEPTLLDPADRANVGSLLIVHGAFVAAFLAYLFGRLLQGGDVAASGAETATAPATGTATATATPPARSNGWLPLLVGALALVVAGLLAGFPALAVVGPVLVFGWAALRLDRDVGFETALLVGGAGLVGLVEIVYVAEQAGPGRMNTVFKVYFQVWVLWAAPIGVTLAELWANGFAGVRDAVADAAARAGNATDRTSETGLLGRVRGRLPASGTLAKVFVGLLVLSTAPYAALALDNHFAAHDVETLDATAFADREHPAEMRAIRWLDSRATHEDTLLEAPGTSRSPGGLAKDPGTPGIYTWRANPASSLTGIPTVAGWVHEVGYRGAEPYFDRVADVDRAYAGSNAEQSAVLDEYDVTYVWVGPTERQRYGAVEFEDLQGVEVAYETDAVTIYRVDQDELDA
ncbi:DUF2298 domain-containing protein [Haloparvum sp. AD34]